MRKYGKKRPLVIVSSSVIWYQKSLNDTKFLYYAALQITTYGTLVLSSDYISQTSGNAIAKRISTSSLFFMTALTSPPM